MFIGYARSGHSLIGALLDAHPNMVIADQLDALEYVHAGIGKQQLFELLLHNSQLSAARGRTRGGHSYDVPGQWQGRFTRLNVIGDKKGQRTTIQCRENPKLLNRLKQTVGIPVKILHVIRNPYDTITTKYIKRSRHGSVNLRNLIEEHFSLCQAVRDIKRHANHDTVLDVFHEAVVEDPNRWLHIICEFLGVNCPDDYATACAKIVFSTPNKSRQDIHWDHGNIELVDTKMASYDFFSNYSFEH